MYTIPWWSKNVITIAFAANFRAREDSVSLYWAAVVDLVDRLAFVNNYIVRVLKLRNIHRVECNFVTKMVGFHTNRNKITINFTRTIIPLWYIVTVRIQINRSTDGELISRITECLNVDEVSTIPIKKTRNWFVTYHQMFLYCMIDESSNKEIFAGFVSPKKKIRATFLRKLVYFVYTVTSGISRSV